MKIGKNNGLTHKYVYLLRKLAMTQFFTKIAVYSLVFDCPLPHILVSMQCIYFQPYCFDAVVAG
ncbi:MAG: hypothetical protein ACJA0G_001609 [Kangiellaceae bacterium]|jgi:hypothetical protein